MKEGPLVPTPLEIERKFLVRELPDNIDAFPHEEIVQGYLAIMENGTEIRLRRKGEKYYQTVKSGGSKTRTEVEIEITPEQFEKLWPLTVVKRVEKTRYEISLGDQIVELDIYHGQLEGLLSAEIEFNTEIASTGFTVPAWLGDEITQDSRYKNQNLARHGIPPKS